MDYTLEVRTSILPTFASPLRSTAGGQFHDRQPTDAREDVQHAFCTTNPAQDTQAFSCRREGDVLGGRTRSEPGVESSSRRSRSGNYVDTHRKVQDIEIMTIDDKEMVCVFHRRFSRAK